MNQKEMLRPQESAVVKRIEWARGGTGEKPGKCENCGLKTSEDC